jgi:hypothetical protein
LIVEAMVVAIDVLSEKRGRRGLHRFVGSEHRPTLVHLSSPLSTIHPGDNAQAATAASDVLPGRTE